MDFKAGRIPTKRGRAVEPADRPTDTEDPMPAHPTLQPITELPNLDAVKRMRLEMGATPIEFAAEHLEDARPELLEAMKALDSSECRDLHVRVGKLINELDDLRCLLAERHSS
jgi:hypothetical protein